MKKITVLDGGMGREIKLRMPNFDPILWSATALIHDQSLVKDIHIEFINAGANIIITNNYMVVPYVLEAKGMMSDFELLTRLSGELAMQAVIDSKKSGVKIAGSLPPLTTTYRADLVSKDNEFFVETYKKMIQCLAPNVDLFIAESLSSIVELENIVAATEGIDKPLFVSFILDDKYPTQLLDGTPVSDMVQVIQTKNVQAVLFNCCQPKTISIAMNELNGVSIEYGAYANAFKPIEHEWTHGDARIEDTDMSIQKYSDAVNDWINKGATIVGGCCGIGPDYIQHISDQISQKSRSIN